MSERSELQLKKEIMQSWTADEVYEWLRDEVKLSAGQAQKILDQEINGANLFDLTKENLQTLDGCGIIELEVHTHGNRN